MHKAIETIQSFGAPINSFISATLYFKDRQDDYNILLSEVMGRTIQIEDETLARYTFLYTVQNVIKQSYVDDNIDMENVFQSSKEEAGQYIQNNPWVFNTDEERQETSSFTKLSPVKGEPTRKHDKETRQQALEFIRKNDNGEIPRKEMVNMIIEEFDVEYSMAQNYMNQYNTKYGFRGPRRNKNTSAKAKVEKFWKTVDTSQETRDSMIEKIINELDINENTAIGYFNVCRKKFGFEGKIEHKPRGKSVDKNSKLQKTKDFWQTVDTSQETKDSMIAKLMDKLDLPESTANGYFNICRKEFGFEGKIERKPRGRKKGSGPSKKDIAFRVYSENKDSLTERNDMVQKIMDVGDMPQSTAMMYYYAARKEMG